MAADSFLQEKTVAACLQGRSQPAQRNQRCGQQQPECGKDNIETALQHGVDEYFGRSFMGVKLLFNPLRNDRQDETYAQVARHFAARKKADTTLVANYRVFVM